MRCWIKSNKNDRGATLLKRHKAFGSQASNGLSGAWAVDPVAPVDVVVVASLPENKTALHRRTA